MHILVTDVLTCPRCGPEHGLVLLAERISARRVLEGRLGCSNCRERYPIHNGFADLRPGSSGARRSPESDGAPAEAGGTSGGGGAPGDEEGSVELAALLGLSEPRRLVLLAGEAARFAPGVAGAVEGLEVIAADAALAEWGEASGVSRVGLAGGLPFRSRSLGGVALGGDAGAEAIAEAARVLAPLGRLVLRGGSGGAGEAAGAAGLDVVLAEGDTVVAMRGTRR